MNHLRTFKVFVLAFTLVLVCSNIVPVRAGTFTHRYPVDFTMFIPCANGGNGELVHLTGYIHETNTLTLDHAGGFHWSDEFNPQGVSGYGLSTGDRYRGTGVQRFDASGLVGLQTTFINRFLIIGQGPGNNFILREIFHLTVNPDGVPTVQVEDFSVECS